MLLRGLYSLWIGLIGFTLSAMPVGAVERGFIDKFCISPPYDELCSILPSDQTDFSEGFSYMLIEKGAQDPFDVFSWQAFVALNWPADTEGIPSTHKIGEVPGAPRAWQSFARRDEIFPPDKASQACGHQVRNGELLIEDIVQSDGSVLIDQEQNFVVYSTYVNQAVADYIKTYDLNSADGQRNFSKINKIDFPRGRIADEVNSTLGKIPSVTMKMAWRIFDENNQDAERFFMRSGVIHIPKDRSLNGKVQCIQVKLGLVGMHIAMRTQSGNGNEWIWSTFEHTDNVPIAANARNVNSIYAEELFPEGCLAPPQKTDRAYSFFDTSCKDCENNKPTLLDWKWSDAAPHARDSHKIIAEPTQTVRCWDIFESTNFVNQLWAKKLQRTVWRNYMLISTQWRGAERSPLFEHGEVPRFLTNTTLETFQQSNSDGTCLGCHARAQTVNGQTADFVFMLQRAIE